MAELQKRIGGNGENIAKEFLKRIGWKEVLFNEDIESYDKEFRKSHNGMDGFYYYKNPFIDDSITNVLISVKHSKNPYVKSKIITDFKSHSYDLSKVIESFTKSKLRSETSGSEKNVSSVFNRGLIIWINADQNNELDLFDELDSIDFDTETKHDGIFLIDNTRFDFIDKCLNFLDAHYGDYERFYIYFANGLNNNNVSRRTGNIMPLEFINSSILPFVLKKGDVSILVLFSIDNFDTESLIQIIGLAKNLSNGVNGATLICYPDYSKTIHENNVAITKRKVEDSNFTENLNVVNYINYQRN